MSQDENLLEDRDDDTNLVRDLRAQLRKAKADEKAASEKVAKFEAENRQSSIAQILAAKNIPAKVAKLIPDGVSDEAGVNQWLGEYGDVFGIKAETPPPAEGAESTGVDQDALAEFTRAQAAAHEGESALAPGVDVKLRKLRDLGKEAKTLDEFIAGLSSL